MFLLRLNWPEPLHIKLQKKKRTVEGGRLGVEIDTKHPLLPYDPFRSGLCGLFTEQCRHTGSKLWSLNSLWLFRREVRTSNLACDLFMLSRLSWRCVLVGDQSFAASPDSCRTDRAALALLSCSKPVVLKHKTIFCLLAQSQRSMPLWWRSFLCHSLFYCRVSACTDEQGWEQMWPWRLVMAWFELRWLPLCIFFSSFTNCVTPIARISHGRWNIRFMSALQLQTERGHFNTCAPLSPAGKGKCVFWVSLLRLIPSKHTSSHTPSLLGQFQPFKFPFCPVNGWWDSVSLWYISKRVRKRNKQLQNFKYHLRKEKKLLF